MDHASSSFPRDVAIRVLGKVVTEKGALPEALNGIRGVSARPWLQEVCAGTLRWKGRLDLVIDHFSKQKKPTGWLRRALLLSAYQLLVQDRTRPASVVYETVELIKKVEGNRPARFANALLHRFIEVRDSFQSEHPAKDLVPQDKLDLWYGLPDWMWGTLQKKRGRDWTLAYAQNALDRPSVWIRSLDPEGDEGPVPQSYPIQNAIGLEAREGFREGRFFVQDISSQRLIHEVSEELRAHGLPKGASVLDLCAAPGGKSVGLAWNGFRVVATDKNPKRLNRIRENIDRLGPHGAYPIGLTDYESVGNLKSFDAVWVDAPCSGTGTLKKSPEIRWTRTRKDCDGLVEIQSGLIRDAWRRVRVGGFLVYSVCSVLTQEGAEHFKELPFSDGSLIRTWDIAPQEKPYGDGFWACLIQKS